MGNRERKYSRRKQLPHIPGQEQAGRRQPEAVRITIDVIHDPETGKTAIHTEGGRDGMHRQLVMFKALEQEMRSTMAFAQRVADLMDEDEVSKTAIERYLRQRAEADKEAQQAAQSRIVKPNGDDVAASEQTKARG